MNKTINANIAGLVFYIEEKAYEKLQQYLHQIEINFNNSDERNEIMQDIESRIAELFQERNGSRKEVVNMTDVEDVISIMGTPEDYSTEDFEQSEYERRASEEAENEPTTQKKLFRDDENGIIGGVCSGLGAYFGMDPVIIRVIFVLLVLFGFSGVFIYIILFFITPEAKTSADKLKMRGVAITVESIKQTAQDVRNNLKDTASKDKYGKKLSKTLETGARAASAFGRMVGKIIGFGMLVGGLFAMLILISIVIGDGGLLPFWGDRHSLNMSEAADMLYNTNFQSSLAYFSMLIILFIPIIGLIYSGVKLLLEIKVSLKYLILTSAVLWTIAVGTLAMTSIQMGMEFQEDAFVTENIEIESANELVINVLDDDIFSNGISYNEHWENSDLIEVNEEGIYMGYPKLLIVESSKDSTFKVEVQKSSKGLSYKEAIENADEIDYTISHEGNEVYLSPYLSVDYGNKFRGQNVEVIVRVPEGCAVKLGDNIERILVPISAKNEESETRKHFSNTSWKNEGNKMIYLDQN